MKRGFTLIELLIVVAIIAILAAIAVPNFLEAQTRAKVSRTASDLRSLATALEAYRVDSNRYPRAELYMSLPLRLQHLTTPMSYITSLPLDPFYRKSAGFGGTEPEYCYASGNVYIADSPEFNNSIYIGTLYSVAGRGPDGNFFVGGYCMAHPLAIRNGTAKSGTYDPTNGTVSPGDIFRVSPGTLGGGL